MANSAGSSAAATRSPGRRAARKALSPSPAFGGCKLHWHLPLLLLCLAALPAGAQQAPEPMATDTAMAEITALLPGTGAVRDADVDRGAEDGVVVGWKGSVYAVYANAKGVKRDSGKIGRAVVLTVAPRSARVRMTLEKPAGDTMARVGDMVELTIRAPKLRERSLLWELAAFHIQLENVSRDKRFLDYRALYRETPEMLNDLYAGMAADVKEVGGLYADGVDPKPRAKGRHAGRTLRHIMENVTRDDLSDFFLFVTGFPGKYYGKTWKISEIYATWVINDAPAGEAEVRQDLLAAATPEARAKVLDGYKKEITSGNMVEEWWKAAQRLSDDGRREEALALADLAIAVSREFSLARDLCWAYFARGYVLNDMARYKDAAATYTEAVRLFRSARPQNKDAIEGASFSLNNRGNVRQSLSAYREALLDYQESLRLKGTIKKSGTSIGHTYRAMGNVHYHLGNYAQALAQYQQAAGFYKADDDFDSLAELHYWTALTQEKLGKNTDALVSYREALAMRRRQDDRKAEARALGNLASCLWRLGRYQEALGSNQKALALQRILQDEEGAADTLTGIGKLYWNLGQFEQSLAAHTEALRIRTARGNRKGQAESHKEMGDLHQKSGDNARALEAYGQARALYAELAMQSEEAGVQDSIATIHFSQHDYASALADYNALEALYRKMDAKASVASTLRNRGLIHQRLRDDAAALKDHQAAMEIRRAIGARADEADSLITLGDLHCMRQEFAPAQADYGAAVAVARAIGNRVLEGQCRRRLAGLRRMQFDYLRAHQEFAAALAIFADPKVNDLNEQAITLTGQGDCYYTQGEYNRALGLYTRALRLSEKCRARGTQLEALRSIAWVRGVTGSLPEALAIHEKALAIAQELKDDYALASVYHTIGALYSGVGDNQRALEYGEKALALNRTLASDWGIAGNLNALGCYYERQGDYPRSKSYLSDSLELSDKIGDREGVVLALTNLSELSVKQGDHAAALAYLGRAREANRALGRKSSVADILLLSGRVNREKGEQALKRGEDAAATFAQAEKDLAQALAIVRGLKTTGAVAECLREQGLVAKARKQFPAATAALEESVRLCEQIKSPHHLWESLYRLAQCYAAQGALAKAEPAFRRAIAVVEELKGRVAGGEGARETFLRSKIQVYEEMAELLGRLNAQEKDPAVRRRRAEEALKYVALARFQILQQSARAVTDTGNAGLDKALERVDQALLRQSQLEEEKQKAITEGNTEKAERLDKVLATNEEQLAQGYADIKAIDPDLDARLKFDPRRLGERVAGLPERAVLVVFFPGKDALHIWVYNRDGIKEWRQRRVPREEIYALVKEYRNGIQEVIEHVQRRERIGLGFGPEAEANTANAEWYRRNIAGMRGALSKLYGHLIAPIEGDIKDADPVLILPYGQLCYLPFECLVKEDAGGFSFLGQTKRLVYFTSEEHVRETLEGMEDEATTGEDVWVAFADPRGRLGSSLEEAKQIAQFFDKNEVHSKDSGTAHKDEVMQLRPDCTILHFATHGFLNGAKPSQTFLELDSPPGDGMLAQSEIWPRLKNQALAFKKHKVRLVTLSACETARAQDSPESEVLGMPDAFTLAGAPSVVASLWSVYTYTTTDLMIEFYRSITKGKMEKAASLQRAKRSLLESGKGRYAHPFFWAPFLLFGDWR